MATGESFVLSVLCIIVIAGSCSSQETAAEKDGTAEVSVMMTETEFRSNEMWWRNAVSWHASRHCKTGRDNCWADDKQIRHEDVVITQLVDQTDHVQVVFHVRDRFARHEAGMSSQQVRSFFLKYQEDVEAEFGEQMELLSPGEPGMEGWLIAVIVISCVLGLGLIIAVAVLASRQNKYKKELERQKIMTEYNRQSDYPKSGFTIGLPEGKENFGLGVDELPQTSSGGSIVGSHGPPPAYMNHGVKPHTVIDEMVVGPGSDSDKQEGKISRASSSASSSEYDPNYDSINL